MSCTTMVCILSCRSRPEGRKQGRGQQSLGETITELSDSVAVASATEQSRTRAGKQSQREMWQERRLSGVGWMSQNRITLLEACTIMARAELEDDPRISARANMDKFASLIETAGTRWPRRRHVRHGTNALMLYHSL